LRLQIFVPQDLPSTIPLKAPSTPETCTLPLTPNGDLQPVQKFKSKWHSPPKEIFKPFLEAMEEFEMVTEGDRVLVCLSGGKDSLSLLHTMRQYQVRDKIKVNGIIKIDQFCHFSFMQKKLRKSTLKLGL